LVQLLAPAVVMPLATSWRFHVHHVDRWQRTCEAGRPFLFLLWHEAWLPLLWRHRQQQVAIVVSQGREGQYLANYARRIGYRAVQGSSTSGGARALLGAIRALDDGHTVAITPDGPRGPRRHVKPGVVRAAQRANAVILPLHAVARSAWRLRSWDHTMIPKPFARIDVGYGEPFTVAPGRSGLEAGIVRCADALRHVEQELPG
jgi:hypothetical protein